MKINPGSRRWCGGPQIFLTPYGESSGLYVSRRTSKGFSVREQRGGESALAFGYRIIARRRDLQAPRLPKGRPTPDIRRPPRTDSNDQRPKVRKTRR